jgi:hypothetical protein
MFTESVAEAAGNEASRRCLYLPLPVQQGSAPQIGVANGDVDPAGNQQQQPLQSVHCESVLSGLHTELHVEPPEDPLEADPLDPLPLPPVPLLVEAPLLAAPLLPVLLLVEAPLLAEPSLPVPLLVEPPLLAEPLLPVSLPSLPPPSSLEETPVPLVLLLQAASPTVDEAPVTTTTRNSLSIFMSGDIPRRTHRGPPVTVSSADARTSLAA